MTDTPLWQPSPERARNTNMARFIAHVAKQWGVAHADYASLWRWSVNERAKFWTSVWDFAGVRATTRGDRAIVDADKLPGAKFFPDAKLNWANNLLRRRDDTAALIFRGEDKAKSQMSWRELYDNVSRLAQAMQAQGIKKGDRVAAYTPNMPETIVCMLAATSLGAVFSSCSPDFGVRGVLDRFGQIEPKILICADGYFYNGKTHPTLDKLPDILAEMPSVERVIVLPYTQARARLDGIRGAVLLPDYVAPYAAQDIAFVDTAFNDPLYILYSSGTTGVPKCIVHGVGGTLLKHLSEQTLHCDVKPGDKLFYFTTCGWMMWNWLASGLASEATLVLYDGSPFYPDGNRLFDYADEVGIDIFGTSAKFIDAINKAGVEPIKTHKLARMRTIMSTGSPLLPEGFDYVYSKVKRDLHLVSISGGTDLIGSFVGGNPLGPVWRGEIQCNLLGMAVDVFDDDGKSVAGQKGELVCTKPFPSVPLGFWNDPGDAKFHEAYFAKYPNVWRHGDWMEVTKHGGMVIYGRSDAVLNPGGVRIGTAEIYRQVEQLDEVVESLVIGQDWAGDVRIVLFVRLRGGVTLDDALSARIRQQIRKNTTPRHVPAKIVQVADIPRTKSGKIVELAVRDVVHGRAVKNQEALANPEALDLYKNLPSLASA
ncbi:MAG: acetoacetate--CoA ligase [Alphaproteobacteria bacterium]